MARDTDLATRLGLLEHIVGTRRRNTGGPTVGDLEHGPVIARLLSELLPLADSVDITDRGRAHLLSLRLYALLQLDDRAETGLTALLEYVAATETEHDEEFWAAGWPAGVLPRGQAAVTPRIDPLPTNPARHPPMASTFPQMRNQSG